MLEKAKPACEVSILVPGIVPRGPVFIGTQET